MNISGGTVGREFTAYPGSDVELIGGDFRLNGVEFTEDSITLDRRDDRNAIFTGTLADGSTFIFSPLARDELQAVTLTRVPLPPLDLTPIVLNSPMAVAPNSMRAGQSLTVLSGGELQDNFNAINATIHVEGGTVGRGAEVIGSTVNISDGNVGAFFYAYPGSEVNISGGNVGFRFEAFDSVVNITGGHVENLFYAHSGSVVNITGGRVDSIVAYSGSVVNITGGNVGAGWNLYRSLAAGYGSEANISGGTIGRSFHAGSGVELFGGEFLLNGIEFTGSTITLDDEDIFTGTLSDGSSFIFSPLNGDDLQAVTLSRMPLPSLDLTPRFINSPIIGPSGLRTGQTLTVQAGGELRENFAVVNATLNIEGGTVGGGVEVTGGVVNISGGNVGGGLNAINSEVNISGGSLGERSRARLGSVVNITGGIIGSKFTALPGSDVNISGGAFAFDFWAKAGSDVELIGGDFFLNGVAYTGSRITLNAGDFFTGTLSDGSTFIFSPSIGALGDELEGVKLTRVALPPIDLTPTIINSPVTTGPSGLRAGQMLTVQEGGKLRDNFAVLDAVLNVEGGIVGRGLEVNRSTVNISDGEVGWVFQAFSSEVNISGGEIGGLFSAYANSQVDISGGTIESLRVISGSVANISGETIVSGSLGVWSGRANIIDGTYGHISVSRGVVDISNGNVGSFNANVGSETNISGGNFSKEFTATSNSIVNISGGTFSDNFSASSDSVVNISGGAFSNTFSGSTDSVVNISGGNFDGIFRVRANNQTNLFGKQFLLDGIPLRTLEVGEAFTIIDRDVTLSGLLADGTPFSFDLNSVSTSGNDFFSNSVRLTVTLTVPEPSSLALVTFAAGCLFAFRKRKNRAS